MKNIFVNNIQNVIRDELKHQSDVIVSSTEVSLLGTGADSATVIKHINDELIDITNLIDEFEIATTEFRQGIKSDLELIEMAQKLNNLGKRKTAETIQNMAISLELKKSEINFDIEKIGEIANKKELSKLVETIGSSKFPIGGR